MPSVADFGNLLGFALYLIGGALCAISAVWIAARGDTDRPDHRGLIGALGLTALWCLVVAALGPLSLPALCVEIGRNLAWIFVLFRLFALDGRHQTLKPMRAVIIVLTFVELLQFGLLFVAQRWAITLELNELVFQVSAMFHIMVAVGALVLLHNLYVGATSTARPMLRWSAGGLAALWAFDLHFFTAAYIGGTIPQELVIIRGLVVGLIAVPLAVGSKRSYALMRLKPSRSVTFQSLSLLAIGAYLLLMAGIAQSLSALGGDLGRLAQVGFIFIAVVWSLLWLPSQRLRGWIRVTAIKHLFQHRYDYRAEWLRFTQTIGHGDRTREPLEERIVKALADITDSPSGLLLLPGENEGFELAAQWAWKTVEVPSDPLPAELIKLFEEKNFILDVDDVRKGIDQHGEAGLLPDWIRDEINAWAVVPLRHFDRITGVVVLTRPADPRRLDWEDFDLLKVVGQQLASYLAEQSGQEALMESARFDEFNRRIAFVMHDIKNLASQLSLLARNAERHAENPDFRADMLVTLRNSADKLNALLARLGRYGATNSENCEDIDLCTVARRVVSQYEGVHAVSLVRSEPAKVRADLEGLEQALVHLVQNAIDASDPGSPVYLDVSADGVRARIEVVDSGVGMSPEFIRTSLFKPFVSSKNGGFGIGAFEAREIVRAMGGRLQVDSREGLGTRFIVSFPLAAVAGFLNSSSPHKTAEVA
ncbi:PEP-CTERM system histidine kinase PrsK [Pontixanthobacter aestiaquae]|uniref:histidine kinase n=1 Tax=Pontixanthobacter aestiaquae TaxID=1509367 RepID=A0A844Z7Y9_9SPHN|nr:XrtA/PEP-CTERM system histidine kinase PrsK [Pontixanthobacter aestiaquae]MDN3645560.1 PEP-CTERM system histidine kinase PrsK [Pontixanthobacter aestiaquae]MXO83442.1 PEP-CTERM system histidine kinase PrsK [Pontixanthobacter aestiaquae]